MPELKGSKTEANLKEAFAGESQANRRYLYFAQKADVEGYPDVAALFRSVAEGETGHAFGHFDFLREVGDPVTGVPVGPTEDNLRVGHRGRDLRVHRDVPRASPRPPATRASRRSPSGSRRWPGPRRATPAASPRASSRSPDRLWCRDGMTAVYDPADPRYFDPADLRPSSTGSSTCATGAGCASTSARRSPRCSTSSTRTTGTRPR